MRDVLVLCYHAVSERWTAPLSIRPDVFAAQLDFLLQRGYHGTTFSRAVLDPPAAKTVAITFDDGFRSVLELALPILKERDLPATMFAVSDFLDGERPLSWPGVSHWLETEHADELACLNLEQFGLLAEHGWEIGSHTRSHPHLDEISESAITAELEESKATLEQRLGIEISSVAYPYGSTDERVERIASGLYSAAAGLPSRPHRTRAFSWPRIGIYNVDDLSRFRLKCARSVRAARLMDPRRVLKR